MTGGEGVDLTATAEALPSVDASVLSRIDIRVGRVIRCEEFPGARRPSYRLLIDFGELGRRRSAARIVDHYRPGDVEGRLVVAVVNLLPRQVGPVRSEVLVLGVYEHGSDRVVLLAPDRECRPGDRVG